MFADDAVIFAESEADLSLTITSTSTWCRADTVPMACTAKRSDDRTDRDSGRGVWIRGVCDAKVPNVRNAYVEKDFLRAVPNDDKVPKRL